MRYNHNSITKASLIIALLLSVSLVLHGCTGNTDNDNSIGSSVTTSALGTESVPDDVAVKINVPEPDHIVVGVSGKSVTLTRDSTDFTEITKIIDSRFAKSTIGKILSAYVRVYENGKLVMKNTEYFRANEVYVEYVYDVTQSVAFETLDPSVKTEFTRIMFPITGTANSNFIVGAEENYSIDLDTTHHYATLIANTDVIDVIRGIVGAE